MSTGLTIAGLAFVFLLGAAHGLQAQDACQPVLEALKKMNDTPRHSYFTMAFKGRPPVDSEAIFDGSASYSKTGEKWSRLPLTPEQARKQVDESQKRTKHSCSYLRDEVINGEPVAVYRFNTELPNAHSEGLVWISKHSGLPLQQETNSTSGAAPNSMRARHEYANVKAPPTS